MAARPDSKARARRDADGTPAPDAARLDVTKTHKLFIGGAFPRSESGRSLPVRRGGTVAAYVSHASRKDLRDAVEAARAALPGWSGATAYNRGQVLYRLAEMLEGRKRELVEAMAEGTEARRHGGTKAQRHGAAKGRVTRGGTGPAEREVLESIDRLVCFAGWADKHAQVLGGCNPVAGPYHNFTVPEAVGVVGVVADDACPLLSLVSLAAPALCAGNTVVAIAADAGPLVAVTLAEATATADVPPGTLNILTGLRGELLGPLAEHRGVDAVVAAGLDGSAAGVLRGGVAENLKRVSVLAGDNWFDRGAWHGPEAIERVVEMKTIWHPSGA